MKKTKGRIFVPCEILIEGYRSEISRLQSKIEKIGPIGLDSLIKAIQNYKQLIELPYKDFMFDIEYDLSEYACPRCGEFYCDPADCVFAFDNKEVVQ